MAVMRFRCCTRSANVLEKPFHLVAVVLPRPRLTRTAPRAISRRHAHGQQRMRRLRRGAGAGGTADATANPVAVELAPPASRRRCLRD
ncbi:MAG: hypothetical protein MZW92_25325 [Comamonadaceae bacterium]|nr:hypothetical protein [Comamonadaceae bacterium]